MNFLQRLQTPSNLLASGEEEREPPINPHPESLNPFHFISHMDQMVAKIEQYIAEIQYERTPRYLSHVITLGVGEYRTVSEDITPDTWFIRTSDTEFSSIIAFPSNGRPVWPDAFNLDANTSAKLPGLSQYVTVENTGNVAVTVQIVALIRFDIDYDASGSNNASDPAENAFAITPDNVADLAIPTRAIAFAGSGALHILTADDSEVTIPAGVLSTGLMHAIRVKRVYATGTGATDIWGFS